MQTLQVVLIWVVSLFLFHRICTAQDDISNANIETSISISRLQSGNVTIVGVLGKPMGAIVKLKCKFEPSASYSRERGNLRVMSVNGQLLEAKEKYLFTLGQIQTRMVKLDQVLSKEPFECVAFETLSLMGSPAIPEDILGPEVMIPAEPKYGYYSVLHIIKINSGKH